MSRIGTDVRRALIRIAVTAALAVALSAASAGAALAAGISISAPGTVHTHKLFSVTLKGSYRRSQLHGTAYVVAFFQYSSKGCRATAKAEYSLPANETSLEFAGSEPHSPFTRTDRWKAGPYTGGERICAYLYPQTVNPSSNVNPIATANKLFHASKSR